MADMLEEFEKDYERMAQERGWTKPAATGSATLNLPTAIAKATISTPSGSTGAGSAPASAVASATIGAPRTMESIYTPTDPKYTTVPKGGVGNPAYAGKYDMSVFIPFAQGSTDSRVATLKKRLASLGYFKSPNVQPTYDADAVGAVKLFQQRVGFRTSGVVDSFTWYRINQEVYLADQRQAQLTSGNLATGRTPGQITLPKPTTTEVSTGDQNVPSTTGQTKTTAPAGAPGAAQIVMRPDKPAPEASASPGKMVPYPAGSPPQPKSSDNTMMYVGLLLVLGGAYYYYYQS